MWRRWCPLFKRRPSRDWWWDLWTWGCTAAPSTASSRWSPAPWTTSTNPTANHSEVRHLLYSNICFICLLSFTGPTLTADSQVATSSSLYSQCSTNFYSLFSRGSLFFSCFILFHCSLPMHDQKLQQSALYSILITLLFPCTTHLSTRSCTWK